MSHRESSVAETISRLAEIDQALCVKYAHLRVDIPPSFVPALDDLINSLLERRRNDE